MQDIREPINERSTRTISVPFTNAAGAPITDGLVTAITATVRDVASGTLIRDEQSVLGANGGTLSGGTLTLLLSQADTQAIGSAALQPRVLTLDLRTSTLRITEEISYLVRAMADIEA